MRKAKKEKKNPNDSMVKVYTGEMLRQILQTYYNVPLGVKFVNFLLLMTKKLYSLYLLAYVIYQKSVERTSNGSLLFYLDVDECAEQMDNCHLDANCINTEGDFQCQCKDGFMGSGISCTGTKVILLYIVNFTVFLPS